ncbi:uncharacterized protein LOC135395767 [Ornithodoros turicata]|uniref:uncharacterized protein LOC135395767 n=1 Tax=Ornithodoros turicata TaxID=34597 RepID=UPI003138AF61
MNKDVQRWVKTCIPCQRAKLLGTRRIHTTAYHPAANGLVERLHRLLKVALTAHANPAHWSQHLPFALLGIRSSVEEDVSCSSAESVYGSPIRLPGDFLTPITAEPHPSHTAYINKLHDLFRSITPVVPRMPTRRTVFVSQDLKNASHVFVRTDRAKPPLTPHYSGPYPVLSRTPKTVVVVDLSGKHDTVALDRLKPTYVSSVIPSNTYLDLPASSATLKPETHTARRTVTWSLSSDRLQPDDALEGGAL